MAVINRIKYDGPPQGYFGEEKKWLVYKFPGENFVLGTQLIVNASQEAIFYYIGQVLDSFGAGRHTLSKGNLPLLQAYVNIPFGFKTPFTSEVYFMNKASKLDMKWGTSTPFHIQDPKFGILIALRSFGQFGVKISDSKKFLIEIIGALGDHDLVDHRIVSIFFKGLLTTKIKDTIANSVIKNKLSIFDITASIDMISEECKSRVEKEFDRFGIEVVNFFIESINVPNEDVKRLRDILERKAEFTQIGDERYLVMRQLDVLEKLAANPGEGGTGMGLGAGLGAGAVTGKTMGEMFSGIRSESAKKSKSNCPNCGYENIFDATFCNKCGKRLIEDKKLCPNCSKENLSSAVFCSFCGKPLEENKKANICPKCKYENATEAIFCGKCGEKLIKTTNGRSKISKKNK
ncbi:MAG: SPFH domain-containing protein [Actinomycetota bacterium]|nr:SPFH domain-containing protein [Actinomycetota bacterium]